jgi:HPt (histidine-containing phosphotransfer) domain-containing protein
MSEPPIDSNDFHERTLGNTRLQAELLGLFHQHAEPLFNTLKTAIAHRDLDEAAKAAHRLAGSAATVSARGLNRQIRALEDALVAGDAEWAQDALPAAAEMLSACLRQMQRLRDRLK